MTQRHQKHKWWRESRFAIVSQALTWSSVFTILFGISESSCHTITRVEKVSAMLAIFVDASFGHTSVEPLACVCKNSFVLHLLMLEKPTNIRNGTLISFMACLNFFFHPPPPHVVFICQWYSNHLAIMSAQSLLVKKDSLRYSQLFCTSRRFNIMALCDLNRVKKKLPETNLASGPLWWPRWDEPRESRKTRTPSRLPSVGVDDGFSSLGYHAGDPPWWLLKRPILESQSVLQTARFAAVGIIVTKVPRKVQFRVTHFPLKDVLGNTNIYDVMS